MQIWHAFPSRKTFRMVPSDVKTLDGSTVIKQARLTARLLKLAQCQRSALMYFQISLSLSLSLLQFD